MSSTTTSSPIIHLPTLLLCILAAAVIWLMKALNKDIYTVTVLHPIQFVYDDTAYIPVVPLPRTITVSMTGNGWNLLRKSLLPFRSEPLRYRIKDPLRTKAINTASLATSMTDLAKDVKINFVAGDTLALQFDRLARRYIPVVIDSLGINLANRIVISSLINYSPKVIRFEGPRQLLQIIPDTIRVQIPNRRIASNYDDDVQINYPHHPLIRAATDRVLVSFEVSDLISPLPLTSTTATKPQK